MRTLSARLAPVADLIADARHDLAVAEDSAFEDARKIDAFLARAAVRANLAIGTALHALGMHLAIQDGDDPADEHVPAPRAAAAPTPG